MDNEEQIQVLAPSALESIERAEIDIQISTARKFPRPKNTRSITEQIILHATLSEETARECFYAKPRAGTTIQGPSVRLSEIVASVYGNMHIAARIIASDHVNRTVKAQAVAWDLENNVRRTAEWSERVTQKASDAFVLTELAAISKAERNAIFKTVPRAIWQPALDRVINLAVGDVASLATRISKAFKSFGAYGIVPAQIFAAFGHQQISDFTQSDLANLLGMYTALAEGTATIDELFKPLVAKVQQQQQDPKLSGPAPADTPDNGAPAVSGVPAAWPAMPKDEGIDFGPEPPRRRGRPAKQRPPQRLPTAEQIAGATAKPEPDENPFEAGGASEPSDTVVIEQADPKVPLVAEIRAKLAQAEKSEGKFLAKLLEWHYIENAASGLLDVSLNDLTAINKRWDQLVGHL